MDFEVRDRGWARNAVVLWKEFLGSHSHSFLLFLDYAAGIRPMPLMELEDSFCYCNFGVGSAFLHTCFAKRYLCRDLITTECIKLGAETHQRLDKNGCFL
jgi:hypothetical protein